MFFSRALRVVPIAAVSLLAACATGDPGDIPCTSDADCPAGKDCDMEQSICVQASIDVTGTNNRTVPNTNPNNGANNGGGNNTTGNNANNTTGSNNTTGVNNGGNNTTGNNANNTTGTNNNPDVCTPTCDAGEMCVNGTCVLPDCGAPGDACDPARPDQNGFTCLDVDGQGFCAIPCERVGSADSCGTGEFCVSFDSNPVCLPSFCDVNADCQNGTCIHIDNQFNYCIEAGPLSSGDTCDPNLTDPQCPIGEECDPSTGYCEPFCDLFGSGCGGDHYCATPVSAQTGICTHDALSNAPRGPFLSCDSPGSACDDSSRCFALDATTSACLNYCRPGENDCAGVTSGAGATVCDGYALYQPGLGLCWPPCQSGDCGTGATCVNQLCRISCTPGNEVDDCCGGDANCPAHCNPTTQLCE